MCPCWLSWLYLWVCCVENQDSKFLRSTWISRQVWLFRLNVWHHKWKKITKKKWRTCHTYHTYHTCHTIWAFKTRAHSGPILRTCQRHGLPNASAEALGSWTLGQQKSSKAHGIRLFSYKSFRSRVGRKWAWDNFTLRPSGMSNSDTIIYIYLCVDYVYI